MHAATRKRNDLMNCKLLRQAVMTVMLIELDGAEAE
jgi:hypothetical protein